MKQSRHSVASILFVAAGIVACSSVPTEAQRPKTMGNASPFTDGRVYEGQLSTPSPENKRAYYDVHLVYLKYGGSYRIETRSEHFPPTVHMERVDAENRLVTEQEAGDNFVFSPAATGLYRLVVHGEPRPPLSITNYRLSITPKTERVSEIYEFEITSNSFSEECHFYGDLNLEVVSGPVAKPKGVVNNVVFSRTDAGGARVIAKKDQKIVPYPGGTLAYETREVGSKELSDIRFQVASKLYLWKGIAEAVCFSPKLRVNFYDIKRSTDDVPAGDWNPFGKWKTGTYSVKCDNYWHSVTATYNYRYRRSLGQAVQASPGKPFQYARRFTLIRPDSPILDAVGDQGNVGSCVAWATCGAIGSVVARDWYKVSTPDPAKIEKFMEAGVNMLDANWFYQQRQVETIKAWDPDSNGEGWYFQLALERASEITIPFKQDSSYGIRLVARTPDGSTAKAYKEISDRDEMRERIYFGTPLLGRFDVYSDFSTVAKTKLYRGPGYGAEKRGGHAVMVVGYHYPLSSSDGARFWDCQNSWGQQWGDNGYFGIEEGACGIDASMWAVNNWAVCDRNGRELGLDEQNAVLKRIIAKLGK
jgi:hypothetical protein